MNSGDSPTPTQPTATEFAAEAQMRFATDPLFSARCKMADAIFREDLARRGFDITAAQSDAARHAAAIALLLAEKGFPS